MVSSQPATTTVTIATKAAKIIAHFLSDIVGTTILFLEQILLASFMISCLG